MTTCNPDFLTWTNDRIRRSKIELYEITEGRRSIVWKRKRAPNDKELEQLMKTAKASSKEKRDVFLSLVVEEGGTQIGISPFARYRDEVLLEYSRPTWRKGAALECWH